MNKERLAEQLNTGELLTWQAHKIIRLENALGACSLTKREHFAGLALQGLLASIESDNGINHGVVTSEAVDLANALLKELDE